MGKIIILPLLLMGCELLPKVKFPLKDIHGIKTYNILLECNIIRDLALPITHCSGGIKDGEFYCDRVSGFTCPDGGAILLTGFDSKSFPKLNSYLEYMGQRFKECE